MRFKGAMTAVITPFRDGRVDEDSLRRHVGWQISEGIDAIVACGTTGEAATLEDDEHIRAIEVAVEEAAGRVPVIAGTGSNCTQSAIELARRAKAAGADGLLQVTPYYNKPTQEGLYQHFRAIAEVVSLPIVLYNVPGRTGVNMLPATVSRLADVDNIVGVKEASGDIEQIREVIRLVPGDFAVLSGEDAMNLDIYEAGGVGAISVTGNVAPKRVASVWDAFESGDKAEARRLHEGLNRLNRAMFVETNPIPAKAALAMMGRCAEEYRLPLTPLAEGHRNELRDILKQEGLINQYLVTGCRTQGRA